MLALRREPGLDALPDAELAPCSDALSIQEWHPDSKHGRVFRMNGCLRSLNRQSEGAARGEEATTRV